MIFFMCASFVRLGEELQPEIVVQPLNANAGPSGNVMQFLGSAFPPLTDFVNLEHFLSSKSGIEPAQNLASQMIDQCGFVA
jgi:hypothetical protein